MKRTTKTNDGITAIYVRRSVSDKDKGNNSLSISAQKEECIRFVGECDYRIYCDDGKSGKDVMHRPAFMQMMSDAREGLISRIIVKKYDRFSRNMREYLNITDELDRYGVTVYSLSEPFNTETKEGRMMRNNLLNFAEFEREMILERQREGIAIAKAEGKYKGRQPLPFDEKEFKKECEKWVKGSQTAVETMKKLGMKPNRFYRYAKKYGFNKG